MGYRDLFSWKGDASVVPQDILKSRFGVVVWKSLVNRDLPEVTDEGVFVTVKPYLRAYIECENVKRHQQGWPKGLQGLSQRGCQHRWTFRFCSWHSQDHCINPTTDPTNDPSQIHSDQQGEQLASKTTKHVLPALVTNSDSSIWQRQSPPTSTLNDPQEPGVSVGVDVGGLHGWQKGWIVGPV